VQKCGKLPAATRGGENQAMASQALYRKWRSQTFDEIIGQQHVTQTLTNAIKLNRVAHAYLFAGPRGTGKTSTARLLAKAVNCLAETVSERPCNRCDICTAVNTGRLMDLIEIDAASNTGVDDIRDLRDKVGFRPAQVKIKFYIIDEVHMLSNSAFNALLKTLEEPPEHVIFVLATTEPEKIPATITSRCQRFDFKRIKLDDIVDRLEVIVKQEGFEAERPALAFIARQAGGSMRDAISLLDQMIAYGGEQINLELVHTVLGVVASQSVIELVDALIAQNIGAGLDIINRVVGDGVDPRQFAREIVEYLRAVMLVKLGNGASMLNLPEETLAAIKKQAAEADAVALVRATFRFNTAQVDIKSGLLAIPQLPLELAFVESATPAVASLPSAVSVEIASPVATSAHSPAKAKPSPPLPAANVVQQAASSGSITVDDIRRCFEQVIQTIEPKSKPMAEALKAARLYRVNGNEITFITFDLMKKRFEKPQPRAAIDESFSNVLGQPVSVRFLSENEVAGDTPLESLERGDEGGVQMVDANTDALLKMATEELGGKIIE
jgi:DNA polymerase-3 subunit gamma/tau